MRNRRIQRRHTVMPPQLIGGYSVALANTLSLTGLHGCWDSRTGVTLDGTITDAVLSWQELVQTEETESTYTLESDLDNHPRYVASVSAALDQPAIVFDPGTYSVNAQWLKPENGSRVMATGHSAFAVVSTTSTDAVSNHTQNCPATIISESTVNTFNGFGMSNGALVYRRFVGGWGENTAGSGYNDGAVRLVGYSHNTSDELKFYHAGSQVGSTATGVTYNATYMGYSAIGTGYRAEDNPDAYGGDDGWKGNIYAVLVLTGEVSGADLATIYAWAQQQCGVA